MELSSRFDVGWRGFFVFESDNDAQDDQCENGDANGEDVTVECDTDTDSGDHEE